MGPPRDRGERLMSDDRESRQGEREVRRLREQARARMQESGMSVDFARLTPVDAHALHEELLLHQVELTIQNEELQAARDELAAARDRYRDLFERAPVGYLILDGEGTIHGANETAANLLGLGRGSDLEGRSMADLVAPSSQDQWFLHRRAWTLQGDRWAMELGLHCEQGQPQRLVRMETLPERGSPAAEPRYRSVLIDVTEQRQAEQDREQLIDLVEEAPRLLAGWRAPPRR